MELLEGTRTVEDIEQFLEELQTLEKEYGTAIQAFDARYVVGREHLARAVELARRANERGESIARDLSVEILLYAAGRRQINQAFEMGISEGEQSMVVVVTGGDETAAASRVSDLLEPAETLESYEKSLVCEFFDITDRELAAVDGTIQDLVCERVALLVVEK